MTARKKSSSPISSIAGKILRMRLVGDDAPMVVSPIIYNRLLSDAKALAGSVLSQDEQRGQDDAD